MFVADGELQDGVVGVVLGLHVEAVGGFLPAHGTSHIATILSKFLKNGAVHCQINTIDMYYVVNVIK